MKKAGNIIIPTLIVAGIIVTFLLYTPESTVEEPAFNPPPPVAPPVNPHQEQLFKEYGDTLDSLRRKENIPGLAVAVVRRGEVIFLKAFGDKKNNTNDPINLHTKFRIASASKGFSSILTGLLVRDSILDLNDRIAKYLPEFLPEPATFGDSLTIKAILSQSSGFPYQAYSNLVEDGLSLDELVISLAGVRLATPPGKLYSYQNVAYSLIEPVMYTTTGKTYEANLKEKIFIPLAMEDASANFLDMQNSSNAATPHLPTRYSYVPKRLSPAYYNVAAAGGINASISDMSQWLRALLGHRQDVVPNEVLDQVFSPVIRTPLMNRYYRKWLGARRAYYGLGWRIVPIENDTIVYHGGYANGFKSHVALDRKEDIAICILSNSSDNLVNEAGPMFFAYYRRYSELIKFWEESTRTD